MALSDQLKDATKTMIRIGQYVVVRTKSGEPVAEGYVEAVDADREIVVVKDMFSGSEVTFNVDTSRYDLWLRPEVPHETRQPAHVITAKQSSVVT
jgi:hypothetical protein